jgi:RNA polymerase sporulation-specific sigma factor
MSFNPDRQGITFGLYARICITRRLTDTLEKLARQSSLTCDGVDVELFSDGKNIESGIVGRERMEEYCRIAKSILSDLEYQVFLLYVAGDSTAKIAEKLHKTPKSVDNAKARMFKSLRRYSEKFSDI